MQGSWLLGLLQRSPRASWDDGGKQHKEEQKKTHKANSATVAAVATSAVNPHFASLMAAMANLDQNK